nr:MAG TPA: hypothetical protein [Caudoviricetes sp.]
MEGLDANAGSMSSPLAMPFFKFKLLRELTTISFLSKTVCRLKETRQIASFFFGVILIAKNGK